MPSSPILFAVPAFFALIGVEAWLCSRRGRRDYRLADAIGNLACGVGQQVAVALASGGILVYAALHERAAILPLPAGATWVWLACFVAVDLAFYWFHRTSHAVNFLWAAHAVHHQSEDYNLSVALRQSWLQRALSWPFYWPLAILGFPPRMFLAMYSANVLYQFLLHTQLVGRLGPLEAVLNTPSHHRVHHGVDPEYIDRNHGGVLIVWDRLFGTFRAEDAAPRYGVVKPLRSFNALRANLDPWIDLGRRAAGAPRLGDKLKLWFMPPHWQPPGAPAEAGALRTDPDYARFDTPAPSARRWLAAALFLVTLVGALALLYVAPALSAGALWAGAAVVFASLAAVGALLDGGSASRRAISTRSPRGLPAASA